MLCMHFQASWPRLSAGGMHALWLCVTERAKWSGVQSGTLLLSAPINCCAVPGCSASSGVHVCVHAWPPPSTPASSASFNGTDPSSLLRSDVQRCRLCMQVPPLHPLRHRLRGHAGRQHSGNPCAARSGGVMVSVVACEHNQPRAARKLAAAPPTASTLQLECMLASTLPVQHSSCTNSTDPSSHASPSMSIKGAMPCFQNACWPTWAPPPALQCRRLW